MKLYLARHTQTNYNEMRLCNADPLVDVHLTEFGVVQAHELANSLADAPFEVIFISELKRTKQTADIINETHDVPMIIDKRLNDNDCGFEGLPGKDWEEVLYASDDKWNAVFNNGESLNDARRRIEPFLKELRSKDYESVLVITHGWIIKLIYTILNDASFDMANAYDIPQGTYATFEI